MESFVRWRYKNGICHAPDPEDPLRVSRWTNENAARDPLLPAVAEAALHGAMTKQHLGSFLRAMKNGNVYWNDTKELMVPPPAQALLLEHIQNGMFWEVLKFEAVRDYEDECRMLVISDNFDAQFALAQSEIQLLRVIFDATHVVKATPKCSQLEALRRLVTKNAGRKCTTNELGIYHKFVGMVGEPQMDFMEKDFGPWVDFENSRVRSDDFLRATEVSHECPWLKVALMASQYMREKMHTATDFANVCSLPITSLRAIEDFVQKVKQCYGGAGSLEESSKSRNTVKFFVNTGDELVRFAGRVKTARDAVEKREAEAKKAFAARHGGESCPEGGGSCAGEGAAASTGGEGVPEDGTLGVEPFPREQLEVALRHALRLAESVPATSKHVAIAAELALREKRDKKKRARRKRIRSRPPVWSLTKRVACYTTGPPKLHPWV